MMYRLPHLIVAVLLLATSFCAAQKVGADETFIAQPGVTPPINLHTVAKKGSGGYLSVRIPSLAVAKDGTILCFAVGRRSVSDWADMDLLQRRSSDGGKTWTEPQVIVAGKGTTVDNATTIVARDGTVHFLFQKQYAQLFHCESKDNGKTFSEPHEITSALEPIRQNGGYNWNVAAPGPGLGVELKSGRLVAPVWICNSGTKAHRPSDALTIYSDDKGKTWKAGDIVARNSEELPNPSECVLIETPDGRVMMNIRNESNKYRRAVAYSSDGASGWSKPEFAQDLYDPICHASMAVIPPRGERKEPLIVFLNPDSRPQQNTIRAHWARPRENFSIKVSKDGGKTWPINKVLDEGRSGYSAIAVSPEGLLYVVYERGYIPGNDLNTKYFSFFTIDVDQLIAGDAK